MVENHRGSFLVAYFFNFFFFLNEEEARSSEWKGAAGKFLKEVRCEKSSMRVESKCTRKM